MVFPIGKTVIPEKCVMGLSVEKPIIPPSILAAAKEQNLNIKREFHISVLVAKNARIAAGSVMVRPHSEQFRKQLLDLFETYRWEYIETDEFYMHERYYTKEILHDNGYDEGIPEHTRRTIVQKVDLPDLSKFYADVNSLLGLSLPVPVAHITIFSWSDHSPMLLRGIGINSAVEFDEFTKRRLPST